MSIFSKKEKEKKEPNDFKELLEEFRELKVSFEKISREVELLKKDHCSSIQKIGIIRFNPFSEVGGDQSFSIALLNGNDDGVVITSLYTREGNRVYGKPIKQGRSQYVLSQEEIRAIEAAQNYDKESKPDNQASDSGGSGSY